MPSWRLSRSATVTPSNFVIPTWHAEPIYKILRKRNAAFCIFEIAGFASGFLVTADFTYIRLLGPEGAYQGRYSQAALDQWATRISRWRRDLKAIYLYFDNDQAAYAVENALALRRLLA